MPLIYLKTLNGEYFAHSLFVPSYYKLLFWKRTTFARAHTQNSKHRAEWQSNVATLDLSAPRHLK
jgi:hypothetical protein